MFGLGPTGQMCCRVARHRGAGTVFGGDLVSERPELAARYGVETIDVSANGSVADELRERTAERGPARRSDLPAQGAGRDQGFAATLIALSVRFGRLPQGKALGMAPEHPEEPASSLPEPPAREPDDLGDRSEPHHALNTPVGEPDPTEWPDPYDRRPDPRDPAGADQPYGEKVHPPTGSQSTSDPHPKQDPEAEPWAEGPKRDKLDD